MPKRAVGYIKHLWHSIRMKEEENKRIFTIRSITGKEFVFFIPYDYNSTVFLSKIEKEGFKVDIHKTLISLYQNKVFLTTGVLFPLGFFDNIVTNRIKNVYYNGEIKNDKNF
jgi:hypothetical protein